MKFDFSMALTLILALTVFSLIEHILIAPRMKHSPAITEMDMDRLETIEEFARRRYPNAFSF